MDTLALLCTLHADGPASLQRLRAADLCSIDDVLGCSVETAADVLGLSMAQARRFHREARMLAMRMHTEGLDQEESMYPGRTTMEPAVTQPASMGAAPAVGKPDIAALIAPVLERWEHDDAQEREERVETPAPFAHSSPSIDVLEGVDDELCKALRAAGYATLRALTEVEPLALSRATNRPYSEACRVRFLAQRAMKAGSSGPPTATPQDPSEPASERFSAASPERQYPQDTPAAGGADGEGLGGPFA